MTSACVYVGVGVFAINSSHCTEDSFSLIVFCLLSGLLDLEIVLRGRYSIVKSPQVFLSNSRNRGFLALNETLLIKPARVRVPP